MQVRSADLGKAKLTSRVERRTSKAQVISALPSSGG